MAKSGKQLFEVQITETRDYVYKVEAETHEEAAEIAMDMECDEAARDSFRERTLDWTAEVLK